ncbi:L,D-transpeptidase family protein [Paracoccus laeviglucosivorans]|uniref:L,D-transpeptidase family protein n=1 Tax=Paracoccus laeviglucosivorans TaxID=1197861 RepID=UPI001FED0898|nr:L,D-transpeptidase family protein [Paracoccus laeviglucosivorans]
MAALPAPRLAFSGAEMELAQAVAGYPGLADFYGSNGLKPIFQGEQGATRRAALIDAIGQAASHGLPPARYGQTRLAELDRAGADSLDGELAFAVSFLRWTRDLNGGLLEPQRVDPGIKRKLERPGTGDLLRGFVASTDPAAWLEGQGPQDRNYQALRTALHGKSNLVAVPGTPLVPSGTWREGMSGPEIGLLRGRLAAMGFLPSPAVAYDQFDAPLAVAVAEFQAEAGLSPDGVAGPRTVVRLNGGPAEGATAILVALERMRWMYGQDPMARQVWVNLPEFSARIMDGGQEVFETRVVIGKADPEYETPEFSETMKYMVVNPRWNVPRSITVKEYLPRLQANRNAVRHLDVVDGAGNVISRDRIDFRKYTASNFPYRMRQKPSDDNALGAVKFMFPNPWNIYLHDTPTKHLFNNSTRAYSHGCIRIGRPMDLAHELLQGQVGNPEGVFSKALASGRETYLNLKSPVPVHLVYFTAFPDASGKIRRFPDIYGRDARVYQALVAAGIDSGLDSVALRN